MELRHLRLVETIAREGTLSRAGEKLHLSQSALSHQLKDLEQELETSLFHRSNKKLIITQAGEIVLESAREILHKIKQTEKDVKEHLFGNIGEIRLSMECYTCYRWLPSVMSDFHEKYPNVDINIFPEYTYRSIEKLLEGKIDLVVTDIKPTVKEVVCQKLFTDDIMVIVPKNHPWTKRKYVTANDFSDESLIIYHDFEDSVLYPLLEKAGVKPKKILTIKLTESAIELVQHGMAVKGMATWAIKSYLQTHEIATVQVTKSGLSRDWFIVQRKDHVSAPYFDYFAELLSDSIQNL